MRGRVVSAILLNRALSLGLFGGLLVSAIGLFGYIAVPVLTGEDQYLLNAVMSAAVSMLGQPLWYHGIVLLLPSFAFSLVGTLLVHRWRFAWRDSILMLTGSIVVVPLVVVCIIYLGIPVALGIGAGASSAEEGFISVAISFFTFAGLGLALGFLFFVIALVIVLGSLSLGTIGGYLLAYGIIRIGENCSVNR